NDQRAQLDSPHSSIVYFTPLSKRNGSPRIGKQPRRSSAPETAQPREQIPIYHLRRFLLHPVSDLLYALQLEVEAQRAHGLGEFGTQSGAQSSGQHQEGQPGAARANRRMLGRIPIDVAIPVDPAAEAGALIRPAILVEHGRTAERLAGRRPLLRVEEW